MNQPGDSGPRLTVTVGNTEYTLLGTAHVSRTSAEEVADQVRSGDFDAVAVELCPSRHAALTDPDSLGRMNLFQVIRQGKAGMVAASLALGAFQQRVAQSSGITPGAEMKAAVEGALKAGLPVWLIDRDLGVTLKRVYGNVRWWERLNLVSGLVASLFSRQQVSPEDIERLKEGDLLEATFAEFAESSESLYEPLIRERDRYMALRLREENDPKPARRVLVVVGAGHLKGLAECLQSNPGSAPAGLREELERTPERSRWPRFIAWAVVALIFAGFAWGFSRNTHLGLELVLDWVLINGSLSALGALLAAAHPLTVITAFVAAPLTSLNPTIGAGFVTAAAELALRKPTVAHFASLRDDVTRLSGWWRNRVSRTLMVFLFSTIGSAVGTYVAGFRIFHRLVG